ncbi:MAG: hypothetical protein JWN00_1961 [Actinomycetia bacterium]|nr:hypothetical protein [Actinomycetes bacterium]
MTADPSYTSTLTEGRGGPTVFRIRLGAQLRRLREARHITREDAGYAIRSSDSKISRLELGRVGFKERDVGDLLTLYGVEDERERAMMLSLAGQANATGWWHEFAEVLPGWFEAYIGLEEAAMLIRAYEVQFVPGLLQTREYAHAVVRLGHPKVSDEEADRRVALRMHRQRLLTGPDAPRLWAVVDEAVLHRPLGGDEAMRAQLEHLIKATELPNVTLQVVPFARGGHAAAGGPFSLLRFADPELPDIVFLEQLNSATYVDRSEDVDRYLAVVERLRLEAEPAGATPGLLNAALARL